VRLLISAATAVTILGIAVLVLLTPIWTHAALNLSGAANSFATPNQAYAFNDQTLSALVFAGDFESVGGNSFYTADEAGHLRDARIVLYAFLAVVSAAAVFLVARFRRDRSAEWSAVRRGGLSLVVGVVVLGVVGFLAFDLAFEVFHRVLFPGGNWQFPTDSNLIRLYPYAFWQLSSAALGVLAVLGGALAWWLARSRERRMAA
jgi:hypothetical protein